MSMQVYSNIQTIKLFEPETAIYWLFEINWLEREITLHRDHIKLVTFVQCQFPPTQIYLESLTSGFNTVTPTLRTIQ